MQKPEISEAIIDRIIDETINIYNLPSRKEQVRRYVELYLELKDDS